MAASAIPPLLPILRTLPDPRQPSRQRHPLDAILALACAAMLAGRDSLLMIAAWGRDLGCRWRTPRLPLAVIPMSARGRDVQRLKRKPSR